ncbi:MAG: hypothetical protein OES32_04805 [Acidobacteriota bacterium]|nr:hypothetical protein [Acidobacteriota bacterium]MDH3522886.1 hypothetical protein [Acidobacteriota bacterium]
MRLPLRLASVALLLLAAPAGAELVQARSGERGWYARTDAGEACVADRGDGAASCWELAPGGRLSDLAETSDGWLAAGWEHDGRDLDVFVVRASGAGRERLPAVPSRHSPRGRPRLVVEHGRLLGIVWLEGASQPVLEVRAAQWLDGAWGPVLTVSPRGVGSQVAPDVTVLEDGRWLALWTAFDGSDDETLWSVYDGASWSAPHRLHEDNAVPDITPVVLVAGGGAIAAWSSFDGRDYRLRTAFFDGRSWRLGPPLAGRGATRAELSLAAGSTLLRYHTVVPEEWVGVELDPRGRVLRRAALASGRLESPWVGSAGSGVTFRWPPAAEVLAPWEDR